MPWLWAGKYSFPKVRREAKKRHTKTCKCPAQGAHGSEKPHEGFIVMRGFEGEAVQTGDWIAVSRAVFLADNGVTYSRSGE